MTLVDRVRLGIVAGSPTFKVSKAGIDVASDASGDLIFDWRNRTLQIAHRQTFLLSTATYIGEFWVGSMNYPYWRITTPNLGYTAFGIGSGRHLLGWKLSCGIYDQTATSVDFWARAVTTTGSNVWPPATDLTKWVMTLALTSEPA